MNARIKQLRKYLKLSQEEFGHRLGVTGVAISRIEKGDRNVTEQMTLSVCREFAVDYGWLTTGEGQMFVEENDVLETIDRVMSGEDEFAKRVFRGFSKFGTDDWKKLEAVLNKFLEGYSLEEVAEYVRQQEGLDNIAADEKPDL